MAYYTDIFSADTYDAWSATSRAEAGFSLHKAKRVAQLKAGDRLVCYVKGAMCWAGVLEVTGSAAPVDSNPGKDAYPLKVPVKALVWLKKGTMLPLKHPSVWESLSFTRGRDLNSGDWSFAVRASLQKLSDGDGDALLRLLSAQEDAGSPDGVSAAQWNALKSVWITPPDPPIKVVEVTCRDSHVMQALLARTGAAMGYQVWVPRGDREAVRRLAAEVPFLETLPFMSTTEAVLRTIENIDVLWLNRNGIVRGFEVEHTTAVYSGILRLADLLALQPNFTAALHVVAPEERREKVLYELRRPAFAQFADGRLVEMCSYLPYEKVKALASNPHLRHMSAAVLDDLEERD